MRQRLKKSTMRRRKQETRYLIQTMWTLAI
nr:MAG TPA: hypothetical protein [Caudoviricetes sp.]